MPADKKDSPTGQDGQQQPRPAMPAADANADTGSKKPLSGGEIHKIVTVAITLAVGVAAVIAIPLGIRAWMEGRIDNAVEIKVRSVLSDQTILRKIAAESRPSLIFNANGEILQDMGAVQYLKPDDIRVIESGTLAGSAAPTKLHIGFVRPVSFPPIVTTLRDSGSVTASHDKGLDWDFDVIWIAVQPNTPNLESRVFRLEIVP
jgi:hypothetical protein